MGTRTRTIEFFEVGRVERRGINGSVKIERGYSRRADGGERPWRTAAEARREASTIGFRAVLIPRGGAR